MGVRDNIERDAQRRALLGATGPAPLHRSDFTRDLVQAILLHPHDFEWSLQGLGMLRTYLGADKVLRLHVWDSKFQVPNVSRMHTHPWDFASLIVAGEVNQHRYVEGAASPDNPMLDVRKQLLFCGADGELEGDSEHVVVMECPMETYAEGMVYVQRAHEIHISQPVDGSVTLVERTFGSDVDHAYVFWPDGEEWVSAAPRPATPEEVDEIVGASLAEWFV